MSSSIIAVFCFIISQYVGASFYKVGDEITVTCPMTHPENQPNETNFITKFVRRPHPANGSEIMIVYPNASNQNDVKYCDPPSSECDAMKNRTVVESMTVNGLEARQFSYTLTADDASFSFSCEALAPNLSLPVGFSPDSKIITIVDPATLQIDIDANATSGNQLDASCKVSKGGPEPVKLVMQIANEELTGLSVADRGGKVSVKTNTSHIAKKEHNGHPIVCFIEFNGSQWENATLSSAALNVLYAPYNVTPAAFRVYARLVGDDYQ